LKLRIDQLDKENHTLRDKMEEIMIVQWMNMNGMEERESKSINMLWIYSVTDILASAIIKADPTHPSVMVTHGSCSHACFHASILPYIYSEFMFCHLRIYFFIDSVSIYNIYKTWCNNFILRVS
jgi:hypothetical protein